MCHDVLSENLPAVEDGGRVHLTGVDKLVQSHRKLHSDLLLRAAVPVTNKNITQDMTRCADISVRTFAMTSQHVIIGA